MDKFDVVILGAGPAGYVAAIRAGQLKLKTAVVEQVHLGGICLNYGCIPTKALLKSAEMAHWMTHQAKNFGFTVDYKVDFPTIIQRSRKVADQLNKGVQGLMRKNKITVIMGRGEIQDKQTLSVTTQDGKTTQVGFKQLVIATGASVRTLPHIQPDGKNVLTYKEAMTLQKPPKSLGVIGAGAIGVEFAYFFKQFGTDVTLIEALDHLVPLEDAEVSQTLERSFKKEKFKLKTKTLVEACKVTSSGVTLTYKGGESEPFEKVLLSIGVVGNTQNLGAEKMSLKIDKDHFKVNSHMQTNESHIYAVGDVVGSPWLAHVASHEAITAVEHIAGLKPEPVDYTRIPGCTYCQPQIASVGLTEAKAKEKGHQVEVGRFPFRANGKAIASGDVEGFVKLVFDAKYGELLGAHLVGHDVTEMISGFVVMMAGEATRDEIIHAIHPHPTCSEAIHEAALDSAGRVLHI